MESKSRIAELKVQYDVAKKDKDLQLKDKDNKLLTRQNLYQQERLARLNLSRNVSIGGIVVLALFLALLYNRHKTNKRTNRLLKMQKDEISSSNTALQQLVSEKELLVKEIHHRVKNNLQIVMSLLNIQSYFLKDKVAVTAIQDSQNRIQSMSLIHQKLYMSDNLGAISMPEYVYELIEYLTSSFSVQKEIRFHIAIEQGKMDVSQAVPIGLILNEAITNSIKYAFPEGKGTISVTLKNTGRQTYCLEIADDGIGIPTELIHTKGKTLGMNLLNGLTKDLLGKLEINNTDGGTCIRVEFPAKGTI
jgi:two-component sensor histidine kinase